MADPATFEAEGTHLIWTTSDRNAADFLAFCEARAPKPRRLTPQQVHEELVSIWADALTGPQELGAKAPMEAATISF